MRASIVRIGNSRGIRIPKVVLEQTHLKDKVELEVHDQQILIRAVTKPRHDWERKFQLMADKGDDKLLDNEAVGLTSWDKDDWQWK
jgi:antitoxin MazE